MQRGRLEEALSRIIDFYKYYPRQMDIKTVFFFEFNDTKGRIFYPNALSFYIASKTYLNEVIKSFRSKGIVEIAKLVNLIKKDNNGSSEKIQSLLKIGDIVEKDHVIEGFPEFTTLKLIENKPFEAMKYRLKDIDYFFNNKKKNLRIEGSNFLENHIYSKYGSDGVLFVSGYVGLK